jgi:hypothetical protein
VTPAARILREVYRRELIPARLRWHLAATGMSDWHRSVARGLGDALGDEAKPTLSAMSARMFRRRWEVLRPRMTAESDERALALVMSGLYRVNANAKSAWIFDAIGGPPRDLRERARQQRLLFSLRPAARWNEVTAHLGELLIVLTEDLPKKVPHARKLLGDVCFAMGQRFAARVIREFDLQSPPDAPAAAIEVLRMSEYVFRVNPEHSHGSDAQKNQGFLEGNACPWYDRPGWNGGHCGIFGQFQAGISSAFGLRYHLAQTIPKHGGTTCRVDLKPITISKKPS